MFQSILSIFSSPKMEAKILIWGNFRQESAYMLQNFVKSWGYPGQFRVVSKSLIEIELQGRQGELNACIDKLNHHPLLAAGHTVTTKFHSPREKLNSFRVAFS